MIKNHEKLADLSFFFKGIKLIYLDISAEISALQGSDWAMTIWSDGSMINKEKILGTSGLGLCRNTDQIKKKKIIFKLNYALLSLLNSTKL